MQNLFFKNIRLGTIFCFFLLSCEDYLEVEAPDHKIISESVFGNDETALSAMKGIYNQLFRSSFSSGSTSSVTVLGSLSADELDYIRENDFTSIEFEQNEILPANGNNLSLWSSAYNMIYMCNAILEGVQDTNKLSGEVRASLEGESKFIRAFTYFYLINLYGEVPLLLTTDYRQNALSTQVEQELVYIQVLSDLSDAIELLRHEYRNSDRSQVNRSSALAMMARVHLYLGNWEEAEQHSSLVINDTKNYELNDDLNDVFLANSKEAIWQISPIGSGYNTNTNEGYLFISHPTTTYLFSYYKMTHDLLESFDDQDKRKNSWIGYHELSDTHFPHKYKDRNSFEEISEYSMVLRLAEQYLIRAEARAQQGNLPGAIEDLDKLRARAGIELLSDSDLELGKEELLNIILKERQKELFTEWGHRWLDLKRTNKATEILSKVKDSWQPTDVFYPIPEDERSKNPNLNQNSGY